MILSAILSRCHLILHESGSYSSWLLHLHRSLICHCHSIIWSHWSALSHCCHLSVACSILLVLARRLLSVHESGLGWELLHSKLLLKLLSLRLVFLCLVSRNLIVLAEWDLFGAVRLWRWFITWECWWWFISTLGSTIHTWLFYRPVLVDFWSLNEILSQNMLNYNWFSLFLEILRTSLRFCFLHLFIFIFKIIMNILDKI